MNFLLKLCVKIYIVQALYQSAQHLYEKKEGSGSAPLTNESESGRPKNMRILRIRILNTDPCLPNTGSGLLCNLIIKLSAMTTSPVARSRPRTDHGGDSLAVQPRVDSALPAGRNPEDDRHYRRWTPERRFVVGRRRLVCTPDPPSPERGKGRIVMRKVCQSWIITISKVFCKGGQSANNRLLK